jgi:hypothetical protein
MYRASYGGDSPTLYRKALVSDMLRFDEMEPEVRTLRP